MSLVDPPVGPDLSHPDAILRLASVVHRFRCPEMQKGSATVSFMRSFKSTGGHSQTQALMEKADTDRAKLAELLVGPTVAYESVASAAKKYIPSIYKILLTCKVQPEVARLDERLLFEWCSGLELEKKYFESEALMYELVMSVACEGMARAGKACDACIAGDFAVASRDFQFASGIMKFLAEDQLPKWISRGTSVENKDLPAEAHVGGCNAFKTLFLAIAQQMAVATVLVKPETPNYSLLGKLCLGIAELMETFVSSMRKESFDLMGKIDPTFFTLVTFEINLQKGLSMYCVARSLWETKNDYGLAISMLHEAINALKTRESAGKAGLPEIKKTPLSALSDDLTDLRGHMRLLLREWEKDNSGVYFDKVPHSVPEDKKLRKGLVMVKALPYVLEEVEPTLLILPAGTGTAPPLPSTSSDEVFARQLQDLWNTGRG